MSRDLNHEVARFCIVFYRQHGHLFQPPQPDYSKAASKQAWLLCWHYAAYHCACCVVDPIAQTGGNLYVVDHDDGGLVISSVYSFIATVFSS